MSKAPAKKSTAARKPSVAPATPRAVASKSKAASASPADEAAASSEAPRATKNILTAGIKALANAHTEVVARQSRVFESLLGLGQPRDANAGDTGGKSTSAVDPFGFKKFEDVFDQRVARTLQRLGVPSAQTLADMHAELERLSDEVARLKASDRKR